MCRGSLRFFSGRSNPSLAERVAQELGEECRGAIEVSRFSDGEVAVRIAESVRGDDCFLLQSTCPPVNENLMELLVMIDAFRRGSAERITVIIPYFGYARQDRKARGREPISAKLVANLLTVAGADRILAIDLHTDQIQGFFDIPVDHLPARRIFARHFMKTGCAGSTTTVVAPDVGGVPQAKLLADELGASLGIVAKRRSAPNECEILEVIGEFEGQRVILYDDMIDTAGTMVTAAEAVLAQGAVEVHCAATHAVLSGPAIERLSRAGFASIVVTDTIPVPQEKLLPNMEILTVAPLLADAIKRIHNDQSVSAALQNDHYRQPRLFSLGEESNHGTD